MKICVGVILYYPSRENINQILTLQESFDCIYLYDNTDNEEISDEIKMNFTDYNKFTYINGGTNYGMAKALNELCIEALREKNDFIITLDQDSIFKKKDIKKYIETINREFEKNKEIGLFGPQIVYLNEKKMGNIKKRDINKKSLTQEKWIITSGSAVNLSIYSQILGFDEKYFIDRVDYDYCKQLRDNGKKILQVNNVFLYQRLGKNTIKFFGELYSEHNQMRNYYIFRNRLYFYNKFYKGGKKNYYIILGSIKQIGLIVLFDRDKLKKIRKLIEGHKAYKKGLLYEYRKI